MIQRLSRSVEDEEVEARPAKLRAAVEEAVETGRPRWQDEALANGTQIEVVTDLQELPPVAANPSGLHDALLNLIFNAVDAMPDGGNITITISAGNDIACLSVRDSGTGMDEETLQRLFEPFFTTKADVGTGLGLSTAYAEIKRWDGTICAESAPGEGDSVRYRAAAVDWRGVRRNDHFDR